ncbi:MAG: glycosyltransferase family A protein, partial [Acidimicrobiales bacterium]
MTPAVSVIIPVFNRVDRLGEAVESVLSQDASVEVVIVDDCSTDGSAELARQIAAARSQVMVSSLTPNKGPAAARNRGLKLATSEFVSFLDSDDLMTAGRLKAQLAEIAIRPDHLVMGCQQILVGEGVSPPALIVAELANSDRHYIMSMLGSKD